MDPSLRIKGVLGGPPPQWRAQSHSARRQWHPTVEGLGPQKRGLVRRLGPQWARVSPHRTTTSVPTVALFAAQQDSVGTGAPAWSARSKHEGAPQPPSAEYALPATDSPHTAAPVRASVGGRCVPARCTRLLHGDAVSGWPSQRHQCERQFRYMMFTTSVTVGSAVRQR